MYGQMQAGQSAANQGKLLALQRERDANSAEVESQQVAARERRKARYLRSRALAVAGKSGAGVSDPTITDILADIDVEGEMSALNALASGKETATALRTGAKVARAEGRATQSAYRANALGTGINALTDFSRDNPSFFQKYGGDRAQRMGLGTGYSDFAGQRLDEWAS